MSLTIFCKVVDNYGDIGICWRLARQLCQEHEVGVTLWVDDLKSFRRICPDVDVHAEIQQVQGITVRYWDNQDGAFLPEDITDVVIEFFGCDIPQGYVAAMAERKRQPVWINLEGLSAEGWVEGCHTLPSMHPGLPLTKYFFFPGFTEKTGGLLRESALGEQRRQFQSDPTAIADFLSQFGVTPTKAASLKVSLFCYPHAPVLALFDAWQSGGVPVICLIPEGVAVEAVQSFLGQDAKPGVVRTVDALTVRVIPFVPQPDYDKLLWACDLNFVRGEDSFVRAQWANKPFIWHIYPQDKNLHHVKLRAFLDRYAAGLESQRALSLLWNGAAAGGEDGDAVWSGVWARMRADMAKMGELARDWEEKMLANGDLASNLIAFIRLRQSAVHENEV